MITVEMSFNAIKVRFGDVTHLRIDATKLIGHQSWREGYGNCKFVIEYTMTGGQIICEYDTEEKWKAILAGLDKALDQPNQGAAQAVQVPVAWRWKDTSDSWLYSETEPTLLTAGRLNEVQPLYTASSVPSATCATCNGLGRIAHETGGYGINCPTCSISSTNQSTPK